MKSRAAPILSISPPADRRAFAESTPVSGNPITAISILDSPSPGRRVTAGDTVIRAGFGTYHEDGQLDDQNLPISNEVFAYSLIEQDDSRT